MHPMTKTKKRPEVAKALQLGTTNRRLDAEAVRSGAPHDCPLRPGLTVYIRPAAMFNPSFREALQNRIQQAAEANGDGLEHANRYQDPGFVADALVAGMEGIRDADGEEVPYTPEIGRAVLADPGNADVLEWVANQAMDFGHFYAAQVEEDEKNS